MSALAQALALRANAVVARISIPGWRKCATRHVDSPSPQTGSLGAFVYDSANIGDEIQTLAALPLFPPGARPEPVNRDTFRSPRGIPSPLPVAFNGWFTHRPDKWPPPPTIVPVLVGVHLAATSILESAAARAWLLRHSPVGCRDTHTASLLESRDIPAFFTGCPTLTLRRPDLERTDAILVIDAHLPSRDGHNTDTRALYHQIVPGSIRSRARLLTQNVPDFTHRMYGWKLRVAHQRLRALATASLVVTNRLHVALPCLAMGTPCVLLHENARNDHRLRDYIPYLHFASSQEPLRDFDWHAPHAKPFPSAFANLASTYRARLSAAMSASASSRA